MYGRALVVAPQEEDLSWLFSGSLVEAGRVADAIDVAESIARKDPSSWEALESYRDALSEAYGRRYLPPDSYCTCGSGRNFGECCLPRESRALIKFIDPRPASELRDALSSFALSPSMKIRLAALVERWAGEDVDVEKAARDSIFMHWAFTMPEPKDLEDDESDSSIIDHYIKSPDISDELNRRAEEWAATRGGVCGKSSNGRWRHRASCSTTSFPATLSMPPSRRSWTNRFTPGRCSWGH